MIKPIYPEIDYIPPPPGETPWELYALMGMAILFIVVAVIVFVKVRQLDKF